uniref:Uncharacterized protein n=1 Tax=Aegilops tauschii subsp. strangulata TaxID=200361 RepID=A0A453K148_AEGTS
MVLSTMAILASPAWGRTAGTTRFRFCSTAKSTTRTRAASNANGGDMGHDPS